MRDSLTLVTGANGFIGSALCTAMLTRGLRVRRLVRWPVAPDPQVETFILREPEDSHVLAAAVAGVDTVIHLAGHAHQGGGNSVSTGRLYQRANVDLTRQLAQAAFAGGVRNFVFTSSVKVAGESSEHPLSEEEQPRPTSLYGMTKYEAERALNAAASAAGGKAVILRLPMVYGPRGRGNFPKLVRAVRRGLPLPLGAVTNRRSMLYIGNLVDALLVAAEYDAGGVKTFYVKDDEDISTPDLVRKVARLLGVRPLLVPIPRMALRLAGRIGDGVGRIAPVLPASDTIRRLTDSLFVSSSAFRSATGWAPKFSLDEGLAATVEFIRRTAPQKDGRGGR